MNTFARLATAALSAAVLSAAPCAQSGTYTLEVSAAPEPRVDVTLEAPITWAGRTLTLATRYAFATLSEPVLDGEPRVIAPAGLELVPTTDGRDGAPSWLIPEDLSEPLVVTWSVPVIHRTLPEVRARGANEHPYLAEDHGLLVTAPLLLLPMSVDERDERARVGFVLPDGWDLHAPWPRAHDGGFTPKVMDLHNDLVAVGNWSVETIRIADFEGMIAFAPGQERLRDLTLPTIERVVPAMRSLFASPEPSHYGFFFGRPDMPSAGYTGSPKANAMTLAVSEMLLDNVPEQVQLGVAHLIAHEFHHTWTATRRTSDSLRFFNEGFTDYYAWLTLTRLGVMSWDAFAEKLSEKLAQASSLGARTGMTLVESGGPAFFEGGDAYNLCYSGGLVVAAHVDSALRAAPRPSSLDAWMLAFNNRDRDAPRDLETFIALLADATGDDVARRIEALVQAPFPGDAAPLLATFGVTSRIEPRATSLRANLDELTVRDIDPTCIHAEWGVRPGDTFLEVHGDTVRDAAALRREVSTPRDGVIRFVVQRGDEQLVLGGEVGTTRTYRVEAAALRAGTGS